MTFFIAQSAFALTAISDFRSEPPNPLDIPAQASRTSGVAPLYVFFNADLKPSSSTERSFHDYYYHWDFGDPGSGTWGTDGKSKNIENSPVAAHVYETPGTYTATLTVRNSSTGEIIADLGKSFTITVDDPDVVFSGSNTICVSDTAHNDFTGCPSGAQQIATDSLVDMPTWTTSNHRLLFHRGSEWTQEGGIYPDYPAKAEQVRIGAYGTCQNPDANGICENAPKITITGTDKYLIQLYNNPDWVIQDLFFTGAKDVHSYLAGSMGLYRLLVLRVKSVGLKDGPGWSSWRTTTLREPREMAIVSCDIRDFGEYGTYAGAEDLALIGNQAHNSDITHINRVWWAYKGIFAHNVASGASLTNLNGRLDLKFHGPKMTKTEEGGPEVGPYDVTGAGGLPYSSQYMVITNNLFGGSGPAPISIGAQNPWSDERVYDVIFEKNKYIADYGAYNNRPVMKVINTNGRYVTIRNNIFDDSYSDPSVDHGEITFIAVTDLDESVQSQVPPATDIMIYNNTFNGTGDTRRNGMFMLGVDTNAQNVMLKNNVMSLPNETHAPILELNHLDYQGTATTSNNIITKTPGFADATSWPSVDRDFHLTPSSTELINKGTPVPVYDDFAGNQRTGTPDIGAYSY